jgi:hypothetical protein
MNNAQKHNTFIHVLSSQNLRSYLNIHYICKTTVLSVMFLVRHFHSVSRPKYVKFRVDFVKTLLVAQLVIKMFHLFMEPVGSLPVTHVPDGGFNLSQSDLIVVCVAM